MKRLNRRAANMAARRKRARDALAGQLEAAGIVFTNGEMPGVKLKQKP
jgi:hypothetical protein